jgi:hypothetical protein
VIDLEHALFDLAEHLDIADDDELVSAVRRRIVDPASVDTRRRNRTRSLIAVAAVFILIVGAVLTIPPARHAIAEWLGIGAVEIRRTDHPLPTGPHTLTVPGAPDSTRDITAAKDLAAARHAVQFTIATPRDASTGALWDVKVDRRVPGGLAALRYEHFTLVEIASQPGTTTIGKLLDPGVRVEPATVAGHDGLWISGAHEITYLGRTGHIETDTVRRSGPVLLWTNAGVTYRIEGFSRQADAQKVAASVR